MDKSMSPEILLETETVLVRLMSLAPREIAPLHFHRERFEHIVCVEGEVAVIQHGKEIELLPGQCISIQSGTEHQLRNLADKVSKYLLTQSGGVYDFCEVDV